MRADRRDDMWSRIAVLAAMLSVAPLGAKAADLMVCGRKVQPGVREIIAAFQRETGKQVDLEQPSQSDIEAKALAAMV